MADQPTRPVPGRYHADDSLLHGLDPRSKLLLLPLLIISGFTFRGWAPLVLLSAVWALLWLLSRLPWRLCLRLVRTLRLLLLFTLLVYVLWKPGYTLWGVAWLSRDGLVLGLQVCLQLLLALGFSVLLSMTTSPAGLAAAVETSLRPLKRLGIPVEQVVVSFRLVLHFTDLLLAQLYGPLRQAPPVASLKERARHWVAAAAALLTETFDRADELAVAMSRGEALAIPGEGAVPLSGFGIRELAFLVTGIGVLLAMGMLH